MKRADEEGTMERTTRPARSEFSLLPWMIAKAVGGIAAALGTLRVGYSLSPLIKAAIRPEPVANVSKARNICR